MSDESEQAVSSRSEEHFSESSAFEKGQRLYCERCQSELEVVNPTSAVPPRQEFSCCGEPLRPATGVSVNLGVEG